MVIADPGKLNEIKAHLDALERGEILPVPNSTDPSGYSIFKDMGTYRAWFTAQYAIDLFDTAVAYVSSQTLEDLP